MKLSDEQRRVLRRLNNKGPACAKDMRTGVRTLMALSSRGLIYVATTFDSVAFPQKAVAQITESGQAALQKRVHQ